MSVLARLNGARLRRPPARVRLGMRVGLVLACVAFASAPYWLGGSYFPDIWIDMGLWAIIGVGLNVVIGFAGLLDLGYMAFYAIGGYVFANAALYHGFSLWETLPIGAVVAVIFSAIIGFPTLRVRGDYLAIMTLGFGGIVFFAAKNLSALTGGDNGLYGWRTPSLLGHPLVTPLDFYPLVLALLLVAALVTMHLRTSRIGRAWACIKDDEIAAAASGIAIIRYKLYAYMLGSVWAGLAGALFAAKEALISPETFTFNASFFAVAIVVLGGMGSISGVILGGIFYVVIAEWLSAYTGTLSGVIFAGLLLLVVLFRPQGLIPYRPHFNRRRLLRYGLAEPPKVADDYRLGP
ncbi:MAG: branched-chain amino acid ABC transporter permease [Candidatus Dormibacteria bacterium]